MSELEALSRNKPSHLPQYLTTLAATMGALAMGAILGYASPTSVQLGSNPISCNDSYDSITTTPSEQPCAVECSQINDEPLSDFQMSWFSSSVNLGAVVGSPIAGVLLNKVGRRATMMSSLVPFIIGWTLIG